MAIQSSKNRKDRAVWEMIDYGGNIEHKGIIYCRGARGNLDQSGVIQRNSGKYRGMCLYTV